MVVADEMQQRMDERRAPRIADDLWTEHDVAQLPRHALGEFLAAVDRKSKGVGLLVDAQVFPLQHPDLLRSHELETELTRVHALGAEYFVNERPRGIDVEPDSRTVLHLDLDHRPYFCRCVPVSSACSLYASTIR